MTLRFSAPGKMVIAGEYAVLEGHPALSAAVDVRASCSAEDDDCLRVSAMGLGPYSASEDGQRVHFAEDRTGAFSLVSEVLTAARRYGISLPKQHLRIESADFQISHLGDTLKLGVGSSAAVAVALTAALVGDVRRADLSKIFQIALHGHLRFSGGRGSGIDVATSVFGGTVRFERSQDSPLPAVDPWDFCPTGLVPVVAFAGKSVSTRAFIEKLSRFAATHRDGYLRAIHRIATATEELLDGCGAERIPEVFIAGIQRCGSAMRQLGIDADMDIVSAPHREIAKIAAQHDGAAKPSGAGGGDIAIAFVPIQNRESLAQRLRASGFPVLSLELGSPGVRRDEPAATD